MEDNLYNNIAKITVLVRVHDIRDTHSPNALINNFNSRVVLTNVRLCVHLELKESRGKVLYLNTNCAKQAFRIKR